MDRFQQYRVFVRVAEMESFIQAANAMELPRASVSAAVQQLETELGTRLLHRTTRRVRLTADGADLLDRVRPLLAQAEAIDSRYQHAGQTVSGSLSVNVPSRIARKLIAPALPGLLAQHPQLEIRLSSTDREIDLVREGVDCVVRVGELADSRLVAHPLGRIAMLNCASPGYLAVHGMPISLGELAAGHAMVGYAAPTTGRPQPWESVVKGKPREFAVPSRVVVNNAESYIACCLAGLGLIQIPRFDVQHLLDTRRLVEVLPTAPPDPMPISLLYPHRRQRSARLDVFIAWFEALMRPLLLPAAKPRQAGKAQTTHRPPSRARS